MIIPKIPSSVTLFYETTKLSILTLVVFLHQSLLNSNIYRDFCKFSYNLNARLYSSFRYLHPVFYRQ